MKYLLCSLLMITGSFVSAQKFNLMGQLTDSVANPLSAATVMVLNPADSSLVNFAVTKADGQFEIRNLTRKKLMLKITLMGFRTREQIIHAEDGSTTLDLGVIQLEPSSKELQEIEITAEAPPVTVKKDTIEFNASSFKTRENAMVEDLLKKLPGVEVDNEGKITAQGEEVKSVMVDGKKFFGNDPKIATKNLPADAVNKVQVFDKLSDQATFTGVDDGEREKTINLELKEERRNAMFGNMMAGAGTDSRLQAQVSLNKFSKGKQLSFLGMGNNINQAGFGMDDYMNFTGGSRQMMGGGGFRIQLNADNTNGVPLNFGNRANGLMSTYAGGVNFNNQVSKKTEVNGSYFYNYLSHALDQVTERESFLPDGNYTSFENRSEDNSNSNHRANFSLDHNIDSANSFRLTTTMILNETSSDQASSAENLSPDGTMMSENERKYFSDGLRKSFNSNLLYRHKFNKKGRSVTANLLFGANVNTSAGTLDALNKFYGDRSNEEILRQTNDQSTQLVNYGATVSYTEPLGKRKYLEANYNIRKNTNDVKRDVYDIANGESTFDESLSKDYKNEYEYHRVGLNFRIAQSDYNLVAGASLQESILEGEIGQAGSTERTFSNVLPTVRFNFDFSNTKHLRFDYETSVREPEIQQLQPVIDNSDPLNVYVGNPALRPSYSQSWRLHYTSFNPMSFINFFAFTDVDYTANAITNAQSIDEYFARTTTPVNVRRNLRVNSNIHFGLPIKKVGRIGISGNYRHENGITILNEQENDALQVSAGGTFRYTYEFKEIFDLSFSATVNQQETQYEFDQPDQRFLNSNYAAEGNVAFLKNFSLNASLDYLVYENKTADFDQQIPFLNVSVSRFLLKNKSGELKLSVVNLLDKAFNIEQTAQSNYLERISINSLGRYFMVSFTYALNKQINPMGMRRRGPMMRITR